MSNDIKLYESETAIAKIDGDNYSVAIPNGTSVTLIRSQKDEEGNDLADGDFGVIPGTQKPSLFKSGADKIRVAYGFFERHSLVESLCGYDPDKGYVRYVDKCDLVKLNPNNGQEYVFASYYGSANDMEKRNGRAAGSANVDNSTLKMAEKRAMVGAVLSVSSLSSLFTMDMEDTKLEKAYRGIVKAKPDGLVDKKYIDKFWYEADKYGSKDESKAKLLRLGYSSSKEIKKRDFGDILDCFAGKMTEEEFTARRTARDHNADEQ